MRIMLSVRAARTFSLLICTDTSRRFCQRLSHPLPFTWSMAPDGHLPVIINHARRWALYVWPATYTLAYPHEFTPTVVGRRSVAPCARDVKSSSRREYPMALLMTNRS